MLDAEILVTNGTPSLARQAIHATKTEFIAQPRLEGRVVKISARSVAAVPKGNETQPWRRAVIQSSM